jgi:hypothetical protein
MCASDRPLDASRWQLALLGVLPLLWLVSARGAAACSTRT